jgi:hypothetical protein
LMKRHVQLHNKVQKNLSRLEVKLAVLTSNQIQRTQNFHKRIRKFLMELKNSIFLS